MQRAECRHAPPSSSTRPCTPCPQPQPLRSHRPLPCRATLCSAEALSERQREAVDQICSELLGSAEIEKQGAIERWDSNVSRWQQGHLVLTRAGHLHFFAPNSAAARAAAASGFGGSCSGNDGGQASRSSSAGQLAWGGAHSWTPPIESLNLARCSFEQGADASWLPAAACPAVPRAPQQPTHITSPCFAPSRAPRRGAGVSHRGGGRRAGRPVQRRHGPAAHGAAAHADAAGGRRGRVHGLGHWHPRGHCRLLAVTLGGFPG